MSISQAHPRFESLKTRERLVKGMSKGLVVPEGLLAHGRGEAFDYLLGEKTLYAARRAIRAAAAHLLLAKSPVISVNGNAAVLVPREMSKLASLVPAKVEVNLFHRTREREMRIASLLRRNGVFHVFGVGRDASAKIARVSSERARVDPSGIHTSDVVLVPLEDGDRASALRALGKTVIAVDLNPLSRTSRVSSVTIVDNIIRALPALVAQVITLKHVSKNKLKSIVSEFNNRENLSRSTAEIAHYLQRWVGN